MPLTGVIRLALIAVTSMSAMSLSTVGYTHGGPPTTEEILLGSGPLSLVTSHGLFTEDSGWAWVCEEAAGAERATSVVRTPTRWYVASLDGLKTSVDGCHWVDEPAFVGRRVLRSEVEHPTIRPVDVVLQVVGRFDVEIKSLIRFEGVGHRCVLR